MRLTKKGGNTHFHVYLTSQGDKVQLWEDLRSLQSILTPALFRSLVEARIPFPKDSALDFNDVHRDMFGRSFGTKTREIAWPALVALSRAADSDILTADLAKLFLPDPSSRDFPEQCLGFQLLLDQVPRALCQETDARWRTSYFDPLSRNLARSWHSLPAEQRPDSWHRWQADAGASFDYWVAARSWFTAPFQHSESLADQETALSMTDEVRRAVEERTGTRDPYRAERAAILSDVMGFPRVFMAGPPGLGSLTMSDWVFWLGMLFDIHKPIIDRFGRYPYLNLVLGRQDTEDEARWLAEMGYFGQGPEHVREQIREDVAADKAAGKLKPLGEEPRI